MSCFFRRDANTQPPAGLMIAQFASATDAANFARSKGSLYTVTAGIDMVYAVRVKESAAEQVDSASPASVSLTSPEAGDRFSLTALTDKGRKQLPEIERLLRGLL